MILGVGIDLCRIERIRRSLSRFGETWIEHLFSDEEKRLCQMATDPALFFARGFCGKEACAKALGIGISQGINWRDIEVLQLSTNVSLELNGAAKQRLNVLTPKNYTAMPIISCSGNCNFAQALVILSAIFDPSLTIVAA